MTTSTPAESGSRRSDVDGLRGVAVLLVVGFHAGVTWLHGAFLAVDVFFVLSGFFLGATLARRLVISEDLDLADLFARRIWRLLPAFVVVAMFTLVSAMLLYAPIDRPAVAENLIPVAFFAGNLAFAARGVNYFHATENPFLHTWTLGVELQLVIVLPLLVALFVGIGERRADADERHERRVVVLDTVLIGLVTVAAISFVASLIIGARAPMWAYFSPLTRLWPFAAGAAGGILIGGGQSAIGSSPRRVTLAHAIGLAAIFAPALLASGVSAYSALIALPAVAGTLLFLSVGEAADASLVGRALSATPLATIGRVSFAWYLWHLPLMVLGGALSPTIGVWGKLGWAVVGLGLAMITVQLIEKPAREHFVPRVLEDRPLVTALAVMAAVSVMAIGARAVSKWRIASTEHAAYAAARVDRVGDDCWDRASRERRGCAFGAVESPATIALLGDSHANHWLAGLDRAGLERGWRVETFVKGGCPVSDFDGLSGAPKSDRYADCHRFRDEAIRSIIAGRPRAVVLSSFDSYIETVDGAMSEYQVRESVWIEGLRRTYARFAAARIPVVVLRGTPRVPFDVPSCLSRRAAGLPSATDCMYTLDVAHMTRARGAQETAARGLNVRFVDMQDQVCAASPCSTMRGGIILFTDDNHLTASFTRAVGSELGARIEAALGPARPITARQLQLIAPTRHVELRRVIR